KNLKNINIKKIVDTRKKWKYNHKYNNQTDE
ncbi:hypothetical protein Q604_UNBC07861G0001, partial [human gut metagenome]